MTKYPKPEIRESGAPGHAGRGFWFRESVPGNILPLALIMMMIILMGGIGIGAVVMEGSKRAAESDQSVTAYYMADSGVERQIYEIGKNNQSLAYVNTLGGTYFNGGKWVSTGGLELPTSKTIARVTTSSFAVLDLFDPDDVSRYFNIGQMRLTSSKDPACPVGSESRMEVSYAYWEVNLGIPSFPTNDQFKIEPKNATYNMVLVLDPDQRYRIRLKTFDCDAINVTASFYDASGNLRPYPGDITLSAEGTYLTASQKIAVTMPKLDVLSGVFGFVLFSECTLVKGTGGVVCP
jgi:hypothetical protein